MNDRAAEYAAKLVTFELVPLGRLPLPRIEYRITRKFERVAMKAVGPRPRHDVHDSSGVLPVSRAVIAGLHAEFLERVRHGEGLIDVGIFVHVIAAVELVTNHILPRAVGRNRHSARKGLSR